MFRLQIRKSEIPIWAAQYPIDDDAEIENIISPRVHQNGFYTKEDLIVIARWKSPRTKPFVQRNSESFIKEVTRTALSTADEQLRIEVLNLLAGVSWPTSSVLLHFGHEENYPILDYRALWSLGIDNPPTPYDFPFWWEYTQFCRQLSREVNVSMRVLDRALWQYSKENQRVLS